MITDNYNLALDIVKEAFPPSAKARLKLPVLNTHELVNLSIETKVSVPKLYFYFKE